MGRKNRIVSTVHLVDALKNVAAEYQPAVGRHILLTEAAIVIERAQAVHSMAQDAVDKAIKRIEEILK